MSALPDWVDDDALTEAEREALELVHAEFVDRGLGGLGGPRPRPTGAGRVMVSREHTRPLAETYTRLVTVAAELVEHAEVEGEDATVPRYLIRRLEREVRGRPQPQKLSWMSVE